MKEGRWLWHLEFKMDWQRGRESHERLHEVADAFKEICNIEIRKDRGKKDEFARQMEQHLQQHRQ